MTKSMEWAKAPMLGEGDLVEIVLEPEFYAIRERFVQKLENKRVARDLVGVMRVDADGQVGVSGFAGVSVNGMSPSQTGDAVWKSLLEHRPHGGPAKTTGRALRIRARRTFSCSMHQNASCRNGIVDCTDCSPRDRAECDVCQGEGIVLCAACGGTGSIDGEVFYHELAPDPETGHDRLLAYRAHVISVAVEEGQDPVFTVYIRLGGHSKTNPRVKDGLRLAESPTHGMLSVAACSSCIVGAGRHLHARGEHHDEACKSYIPSVFPEELPVVADAFDTSEVEITEEETPAMDKDPESE